MRGARFRPFDFLASFDAAIREAVKHRYKTVKEARGVIESMIYGEIEDRSYTGKEGLEDLEDCLAGAGDYQGSRGCRSGEITWDGQLPAKWALEAWREEERVW
jgi:hypothetical protein